jgi:hypothetical protein
MFTEYTTSDYFRDNKIHNYKYFEIPNVYFRM